ncbi:MAG: DNA (cytosine-5-)-methyltransferase [Actinomycetota bacterium]
MVNRNGERPSRTVANNRVVELFAGVGGFRLALERSGWRTVWANQWEPSTKAQHAADCYNFHWPDGTMVNEDINTVVDKVPTHDLLVGGFPCQDYSVAKTLNQAKGLQGIKGVLWWSIYDILERRRPRHVFLENVDRLLKSPASHRGRDFAIILSCLAGLGYMVEWRVVNAAEYGFPQRRKRVFIVATRMPKRTSIDPTQIIFDQGVLAQALPVWAVADVDQRLDVPDMTLAEPDEITTRWPSPRVTPFLDTGVMWQGKVWTRKVKPNFDGKFLTLGDMLVPDEQVPDAFFVPDVQLERWEYLKGAKSQDRMSGNGHQYRYQEGAIAYPDPTDRPARTILTGEGGATPSRMKHLIETRDGRHRRLTPIELERLNGFPDDWTKTGMPDGKRAFMMGNALVVGLVEQIGRIVAAQ